MTQQHEMSVMDPTGHTSIKWDQDDPQSIEVAKATFSAMTAKGYRAFHVKKKEPSVRMSAFDPAAEKMILIPQLVGG